LRDASAFLGTWAFAGVPGYTLAELLAAYRDVAIDGAALSPIDAVLQPEPMAGNRRLLAELADGLPPAFRARAVPIINPSLPGWQGHVADCRRAGGDLVRALKVVPSYHDYQLDHPAVQELARLCLEQDLGLCVQVRMEDERMHHPAMRVPPVAPTAVVALAARHPRLPILVCGGYMAELAAYRDYPSIRSDLSFVESGMVLHDALQRLGSDRLLVGTHAPIHMLAPNVAKLGADTLDASASALMATQNFDRFFAVH
jgi:uncharacterized protein